MTEFSAAFRDHVVPRLDRMIRFQAIQVGFNDVEFSQAASAVMGRAVKMGASYLPPSILLDLEDWVITKLASYLDEIWSEQETWRTLTSMERADAYRRAARGDQQLYWSMMATDSGARNV